MKMKLKTKRLNKTSFLVKIKHGKGWGEVFIKECSECGNVFVTSNPHEIDCKQCMEKFAKEYAEKTDSMLDKTLAVLKGLLFAKEESTKQTKPKNDTVRPKNDTVRPKNDTVKTNSDGTYELPRTEKYYTVFNYVKNNPAKIKVPKYEEKYAFIKRTKPVACVNKDIGLKIMELVAKGHDIKSVSKIFKIKESSTYVYFNDLKNSGLILNTSQGWMINPAIEYELI